MVSSVPRGWDDGRRHERGDGHVGPRQTAELEEDRLRVLDLRRANNERMPDGNSRRRNDLEGRCRLIGKADRLNSQRLAMNVMWDRDRVLDGLDVELRRHSKRVGVR